MFGILTAFLFFAACSSHHSPAPVSSRGAPPPDKIMTHIVAPGETLFSIAWRYGLDYKGLAQANNITAEYTIFPGQIISLRESFKPIYQPQKTSPKTRTISSRSASKRSIDNESDQKAVNNTPVKKSSSSVSASSSRSENKSSVSAAGSSQKVVTGQVKWRWPANGRVITNFYATDSFKKGIDIEGKKGESVSAAASGQVVYAGSGLRGYGKLVIIKHSDTYLSAYAHNSRIRVQEGDSVSSGQHIADIGSTGTGTRGKPKLHFQIRRDGKPIDPLRLLPKRNR